MLEVTYRLESKHLQRYRKLASDRAYRGGERRPAVEEVGLFLLCVALVGGVLVAATLLFELLAQGVISLPEFILGLLSGIALIVFLMWRRYADISRRAVKPDGPTLSEHTLAVTPEGLKVSSRLFDVIYRWAAFEEVAVYDDIIVLWIEPGGGTVVPRAAFPDSAAEAAFLEAVRGSMREGPG